MSSRLIQDLNNDISQQDGTPIVQQSHRYPLRRLNSIQFSSDFAEIPKQGTERDIALNYSLLVGTIKLCVMDFGENLRLEPDSGPGYPWILCSLERETGLIDLIEYIDFEKVPLF